MIIDAEPIDDEGMLLDGDENDVPRYTPTPEQIAEAAAEIRRGWSPQEEFRRRAVQPSRELWFGAPVKIGA